MFTNDITQRIDNRFSGGLYLLPIFSDAYADKIGFRKSMIIAFSLLSIGYLGLGVLPTLLEAAGLVSYGATPQFNGLPDSYTRWIIVPALFETREAWEAASGNAHYIWYYFAAIGLIAAVALLLFAKITESIDKKKEASR